jgi:hypothetical protein
MAGFCLFLLVGWLVVVLIVCTNTNIQCELCAWQLGADLGVPTNLRKNSTFISIINEYGTNLTAIVEHNLLNQPQHSIFLDSCEHHCGGWGSYHAGPENTTQPLAMKEWYEAMDGEATGADSREQKTWVQGKPYPCDSCCN